MCVFLLDDESVSLAFEESLSCFVSSYLPSGEMKI